jgi:muramoyltetrapeptide carboxypeptidase
MEQSPIKPKRLPPGGTIGVIAPAGKVDLNDLNLGVVSLEQAGFKVILGNHITKTERYFAGADRERADDLFKMMQNESVDAVFCARGGSGSARIIPYIDEIKLHPLAEVIPPKIFVGCSDITTLLLYLSKKHGFVTFHGPMVATQLGLTVDVVPPSPLEYLLKVLLGECIEMRAPNLTALKSGRADGILTGGCLTLLCTTIGTDYEMDTKDKLLFVEDIAEAPYRIDRMLNYLKTLKKFDHIRGLIVGQMPDCSPDLLPEMILETLADFDFPILFSFPSGHGDALFTLPFGTPVRMDADEKAVTLLSPAVSFE